MIFDFHGERQHVAHRRSDALVFGWRALSRVRQDPARPSEGLSSDLSLDSVRGSWSVACDGSSREG
jgi:hypothetical protein